jgi:PfaD family protein
VRKNDQQAVSHEGSAMLGRNPLADSDAWRLIGYAPPLLPQHLGDPNFRNDYDMRYAYVVGAMANGITSVNMVEAACRAGLLAFFGAAGLSMPVLEKSIFDLSRRLTRQTFGMNLIHSPGEPQLEQATVDLYLRHGVNLVSASAYMRLTLPLVKYRLSGIYRDAQGKVHSPNRVVAKVSREEVARLFLSPPPVKIINQLVAQSTISPAEAEMASEIAMCDDLTAEADSGGHTDNRPALALLSTMITLRDALAAQHGFHRAPRVGLAGGIATPHAVAAAFAMGAAYVLTGSINQGCVESGTSLEVRQLLSQAGQADVTMAPSADMFELGVKVQVLKRGTMFPQRAQKLYDLYSSHQSYEQIPAADRELVEKDYFKRSFEAQWAETRSYFLARDPAQIERAETDDRHRMALVFRSYLGSSSNWANQGKTDRQIDYQVWCGPAMGAFNEWTRQSFLSRVENRDTVTVALNLMHGAATLARAQQLRQQQVALPPEAQQFVPRTREVLLAQLE